jgi:hypothetical protein
MNAHHSAAAGRAWHKLIESSIGGVMLDPK